MVVLSMGYSQRRFGGPAAAAGQAILINNVPFRVAGVVPAEFFGVTSGLGYTIEDARESLNYDHLMATVLIIGAIGYLLDSIFVRLIKRYSWHRGT